MKRFATWTLVLILIYVSNAFAAPRESKAHIYSPVELKNLVRSVYVRKSQCQKAKCRDLKTIVEFENLLNSFIALKEAFEATHKENLLLKNEISILSKSSRKIATNMPVQTCYKKQLLNELLLNEGIEKNGSVLFPKKNIAGTAAVCWANSRKKKEASITLCEFPLAINIQTKGGGETKPIIRSREYLFQVNGCDLVAVHIKDESAQSKFETSISYNTCIQNWNKRTADAAMSKTEVQLLEDTIGYCFREHLLPPVNSSGGRANPQVVEGPGPSDHK